MINSQMSGNGDFLLRERRKTVMNIKEAKKINNNEAEETALETERGLVKWPDNLDWDRFDRVALLSEADHT